MKKSFITLLLFVPLFSYPAVFAVETAPRISDREIIEGLSTIRGDINELRATIRGDVTDVHLNRKKQNQPGCLNIIGIFFVLVVFFL